MGWLWLDVKGIRWHDPAQLADQGNDAWAMMLPSSRGMLQLIVRTPLGSRAAATLWPSSTTALSLDCLQAVCQGVLLLPALLSATPLLQHRVDRAQVAAHQAVRALPLHQHRPPNRLAPLYQLCGGRLCHPVGSLGPFPRLCHAQAGGSPRRQAQGGSGMPSQQLF